jgi:hypothetical protein
MGGIFISYRRQDSSGHTGRLRDHLQARFGALVFQDVDDIPDGEIFETVLSRALESCDVALVVIGRMWLSATDAQGRRRLDDPEDWVRVETRQLLQRNIRVIPVLVGGATMPQSSDLPGDIQGLVKRQARELRDTAWEADVRALVQRLSEIVHVDGGRTVAPAASGPKRGLALGALALLVVAAGAWLVLREPTTDLDASSSAGGREPAVDIGVQTPAAPPAESRPRPDIEDGPRGNARDPVIEAARAIRLLGTWGMDDFSGFERPADAATTYGMKVVDGAVRLVPVDGNDPSDVMTVKQIQGRAVTLTHADVGGRPFDYMYVFNLSADSDTLDDCATVAVSNFEGQGPCQWRYRRVAQGARASAPARADASCTVESAADPACLAAAQTLGLLGDWQAGDGARYRFYVEGAAVRFAPADAGEAKFAVRSIEGDKLTLGWTPFEDASEFDPQQIYRYHVTIDGARLVNCRSLMRLSARTDESQCTDVPPFLVRASD